MTHLSSYVRRPLTVLAALAIATSTTACGDDAGAQASGTDEGGGATASTLRLGYFANVTHAAALIGLDQGLYEEELGNTTLETQVFNAGPAAVEAVFAGALDATYIGPNPAINAFAESGGEAIRIIAGATSGGAQLVVREGIDEVEDLEGTTLATPQLGNTQDVALRAYLSENGLENSVDGGGDVTITPTPNADTLSLFQSGDFDGAWLPEPWASRLVLEAGAHVLVDEKELWPDGEFVTTHLIVRTEFLEQYPGTVDALLRAHVAAVAFANEKTDDAKEVVNGGIERDTGEALATEVLDRAWENLTVTDDPIAASLQSSADDAVGGWDFGGGDRPHRDLQPAPAQRDPRRTWRRSGFCSRSRGGIVFLTAPTWTKEGAGKHQAGTSAGAATTPAVPTPAVATRQLIQVFEPGLPPVLDRIDLDITPGEFVCLLGASGCGKSTLLNLMAGLLKPSSGTIALTSERPALMFQEPALLPWLTASANVELALRARGVARDGRRIEAARLLEVVNLGGQGAKRVHELSGGMRQRVALARALAQDSQVLLMDEPFAALDAITRDVLHEELIRLWAERGLTVVFVTHNVREAVRLSQRVVLMSSRPGRIVREWTVGLSHPRTIEAPGVSALSAEITTVLRKEISRHGR